MVAEHGSPHDLQDASAHETPLDQAGPRANWTESFFRPMPSCRAALLMTFVVLVFGLTLFIVSARIWLPADMAAPAPVH